LDDVIDGIEDSVHRMLDYRIEPIPSTVLELCHLVQSCCRILQKAFDALAKANHLSPTALRLAGWGSQELSLLDVRIGSFSVQIIPNCRPTKCDPRLSSSRLISMLSAINGSPLARASKAFEESCNTTAQVAQFENGAGYRFDTIISIDALNLRCHL